MLRERVARNFVIIFTSIFLCIFCSAFAGEIENSFSTQVAASGSVYKTKLQEVYAAGQPVWIEDGKLNEKATRLLEIYDDSILEGLSPEEYKLKDTSELSANPTTDEIARKDVAISESVIKFISHLATGVDNRKIRTFAKDIDYYEPDFPKLFEMIRQTSAGDLAKLFEGYAPKHAGYKLLKEQLVKYTAFEKNGGFRKVTEGEKIEPGAASDRIVEIRERLYQEGYIKDNSGSSVYDGELETAIKSFQGTRGITPDGIIGKSTVSAMNKPAPQLVKQIKINMDRWRYMPKDFGARYAMVNLAGFYIDVFENGKKELSMKVINGEPSHPTPIFASEITGITFFPHWNVPKRIAVQKLVPKINKNSDYLQSHNYHLYLAQDGVKTEIDPASVDWQNVDPARFPYIINQDPGSKNSLGRIKFNIVNDYDVYLHGTPEQKLFSKDSRVLSSGCVRLEDPVKFASFVLKGQDSWTEEKIATKVAAGAGSSSSVKLENNLKTYLLYLSSWVDENGQVHFVPDVYRYDARAAEKLFNR